MKTMIFESPIGPLLIKAAADGLKELTFADEREIKSISPETSPLLSRVFEQLEEYFRGERTSFAIPLAPEGTDFQKSVWEQLREIPFGVTTTYGKLSARLGDPGAIRAVGKANGQNPIPIIIPCHRVVGSGGDLVGYSGGIERKRWLLQHEGALLL